MVRQARCNRVHSAVTPQVNVIEAGRLGVHATFLKLLSDQLPLLGSRQGMPQSDKPQAGCAG